MSTIEQSSGLANSAISKVLRRIVGTTVTRGHLYLMKGAVPTSLDAVLNPNKYRRSDRLVSWNRNQIIVNQGVVSTTASMALESGAVTWFYFYRIDSNRVYQIAGTVTGQSLGGNLELINTSIVKDQTYDISDMGFDLGKEFTDIPIDTIDPRITITPTFATWNISLQSISIIPTTATWNISLQSISIIPTTATWNVSANQSLGQSISIIPTTATWNASPATT